MSQRGVEIVLGRLVTDAETRRRFERAPAQALRELTALGPELTTGEIEALALLDPKALARFAQAVDHRLRKAMLVTRGSRQVAETEHDDSGEGR